ncbi:MAG: LamG domain-containing protein [Sphingobacteriia bacterium]|jgi:hypothetical protein
MQADKTIMACGSREWKIFLPYEYLKMKNMRGILLIAFFSLFAMAHGQGAGSALDFNGVAGGIRVGNSATLNFGLGDFSLELWVRVPSTLTLEELVVVGKRPVCGNSNFWNIRTSPTDGIYLEVSNSALGEDDRCGAGLIYDGEWHHVAFVRRGREIRSYRDGSLFATTTLRFDYNVDNSVDMFIGDGVCAGIGRNGRMQGNVDELRIWSRALTEEQIRHKMTERLRNAEPGLVAYYRLDEGADNTCPGGQDVCDASGNANHGVKF